MWGKPKEWLPWYRADGYEGNLTEAEKRQLDAFRAQPKHPAAQYGDLPEEVQGYINNLEIELEEQKQGRAAGRAFVLSGVGAAILYLAYKDFFGSPHIWANWWGALLLVLPWIWNWYEERKIAQEYWKDGNPTDEGIRKEWELNYVVQKALRERKNSPEGTPPEKPSRWARPDNRRAVASWTAIIVFLVACYMGWGIWPSMALYAAVWMGMHLLLGVKMRMWA